MSISAALQPFFDRDLLMSLILPHEAETGSTIFRHWSGAPQDLNVRAAVATKKYATGLAVCFRNLRETRDLLHNGIRKRYETAFGEENHALRLPQAEQRVIRFGLPSLI
jgi:hypothetical protein